MDGSIYVSLRTVSTTVLMAGLTKVSMEFSIEVSMDCMMDGSRITGIIFVSIAFSTTDSMTDIFETSKCGITDFRTFFEEQHKNTIYIL